MQDQASNGSTQSVATAAEPVPNGAHQQSHPGAGATVPVARLRRHNLLNAYLRAELIDQAVSAIELSDEEIKEAVDEYCRRKQLPGHQALAEVARVQGIGLDELTWQILLPRRFSRLAWQQFNLKAEQRFLERKASLDQVVYSLIRVKDANLARELYLQLQEGEASFAELASQLAEGPERQTNGIVGPVPLTQAHPVLADRLRTLQPNEMAEPMHVAGWVLLVRLERYLPAVFTEAVAQQMCHEQLEQWVQEQVAIKVAELCPSAPIGAIGSEATQP
jgi:parvulin-like peptidyl-prolyl isomerase